jgi:benzodiazapine receptor
MSTRKAPVYAAAATVVTAPAAFSARAVNLGTAWYRTLDKPSRQPPSWTFGAVWTPLYATIAWSAGRAALHTRGRDRRLLPGAGAVLSRPRRYPDGCSTVLVKRAR